MFERKQNTEIWEKSCRFGQSHEEENGVLFVVIPVFIKDIIPLFLLFIDYEKA